MLTAVVLAAGNSRRMGTPKALLKAPDGRPFVTRIVRTLRAAGVEDVVVVTGRDHDAIVDALSSGAPDMLPRFVRNDAPERGQLSSLWAAMDAAGEAEAIAMTLVDVPMLTADTVARVVDTWRRTRAPIVRPAIGERHGHPVIFDRSVFGELRHAPLELGAKTVVRAHASDLVNVTVSDEGCLADVDTPSDYERLRSR